MQDTKWPPMKTTVAELQAYYDRYSRRPEIRLAPFSLTRFLGQFLYQYVLCAPTTGTWKKPYKGLRWMSPMKAYRLALRSERAQRFYAAEMDKEMSWRRPTEDAR